MQGYASLSTCRRRPCRIPYWSCHYGKSCARRKSNFLSTRRSTCLHFAPTECICVFPECSPTLLSLSRYKNSLPSAIPPPPPREFTPRKHAITGAQIKHEGLRLFAAGMRAFFFLSALLTVLLPAYLKSLFDWWRNAEYKKNAKQNTCSPKTTRFPSDVLKVLRDDDGHVQLLLEAFQ